MGLFRCLIAQWNTAAQGYMPGLRTSSPFQSRAFWVYLALELFFLCGRGRGLTSRRSQPALDVSVLSAGVSVLFISLVAGGSAFYVRRRRRTVYESTRHFTDADSYPPGHA